MPKHPNGAAKAARPDAPPPDAVLSGPVAGNGATPAPVVPVGGAGGLAAPAGGVALGLNADVSGELADLSPTFGNVLKSIGEGVAQSQAALDRGVIDVVKRLNDTKITVVTEVVETLNDDGLPSAENTQLVTNELSVLNFVMPTVHQWQEVAVSMDLEVGALDSESGVTFKREQRGSSMGGVGLAWGYVGWFDMSFSESTQTNTSSQHTESDWAQGTVRLDAHLAPRRTTKFPVPAAVEIGPQIFASQGAVAEKKAGNVVTERAVDVLLTVRKASGAPNPSVVLELDAAGLLPSFKTEDGFTGSTTNAEGQVRLTLTRAIANPAFSRAFRRTLTASLGQIRKRFDVVI